MNTLCILDIGSHKAEEVMLLEGRPTWTTRNRLRVLRSSGYRPDTALNEIASVNRLSRQFSRSFRCRYVLVEPIMHDQLMQFVRTVPSLLVSGVSSCNPSGSTELFMANDSLGNSIIPSKPGLSGTTRETFNVNFPELYEFVVSTFIHSGDCSRIIIRMNAEGVEGPIIDFLAAKASVKPAVLAGSLGDIRKCFGEQEYDRAMSQLDEAAIPFVYFTSSPASWAKGLESLMTLLSP
jgi:hypothetical protein